MRASVLRIVLMIGLFVVGVLPAAAQVSLDTTTAGRVNVRSGPGTEWRVVGTLPPGTAVRLDGRAPSGGFWVRGVASDGTRGWMGVEFLTIDAAQTEALPAIWVDAPFVVQPPGAAAAPADSAPSAPVESAPLPPPAANSPPVRGFNLGGHVQGLGAHTVNAMRLAGMTWVKKQAREDANFVAMINEAHANGFRILLGVVGDKNRVGDDAYLQSFANLLGRIAAAGADAIEVWNEPNIDREWAAGQISPQRYTQLLAWSYNAIKGANPGTLVVSGAPAPTGFFGGCGGNGCDDNAFLAGMAAAGAARYMDCIGVHYNEGILPPSATSGDPRGNSGHYTRYFWGMINTYYNAFGGARQLCFTELGYLSPEGYGPLPGAFGWAVNTTAAQQAQWLDQAVTLAARSGRVRLLIIWNVDFTDYGADPMAGYAMIRPGGACPACELLGR